MAFRPDPVRRPREQVEGQLREAIFSGEFKSGDKLPSETELAEKFSVSRTRVRAALGSLETSGLINKVAGATGGASSGSWITNRSRGRCALPSKTHCVSATSSSTK